MSSAKTEWTKPQLIVLARGTPQESVLVNCKTMNPNMPATGPTDLLYQDTCAHGANYNNCSNCQSRGRNDT
ncbi:MAG: hypothetical protein LUO80_09045 [Methylococcaceae bacterium]|jgi:hypothetical protein|nr:hypothetical protein [Methylococcaceae bacterium]